MIKAVFFDIDGTLVDSNGLHVAAWREAFDSEGFQIAPAVIAKHIGKGADMLIPAILPHISDSMRDVLAQRHDEIFRTAYRPRARAFAGATALVTSLRRDGLKVVLATSAGEDDLGYYIHLLQLVGSLSATVSADDVKHSKPAADIFASALAKVKPLIPQETLVVGDTPYDVIAAAKCGINTIALRSGGFVDAELNGAGAIAIYDDVEHLLRQKSSSPLFVV